MPEFIYEKKEWYQRITVKFNCKEDVDEFAKLINQKLTPKTKSICFPKLKKENRRKIYVN